jgi:hypothetical protein
LHHWSRHALKDEGAIERVWACTIVGPTTRSEGRISVAKRRHGLARCRYKGFVGMNRWVGLGVIADNLVYIGRTMAMRATT